MRTSVLDLSPIVEGGDAAQAFRNTLDLARHAEAWGYQRYWLAEHHGMPGIASAATAVVIAHVAGGTSRIRVGAGGIMLPNHAPLVVAEQFATLESLFPGRIDLALGRAPGTDPMTARALRRHHAGDAAAVRAVPGAGLRVPIWILGSRGVRRPHARRRVDHRVPDFRSRRALALVRDHQPGVGLTPASGPYMVAICRRPRSTWTRRRTGG
jgi:alkanesulfonate monooxygenase SsuD/methylene tetrahydromethanopterin reductase-like flavin-dependent oxidoreductase (luciferase family)